MNSQLPDERLCSLNDRMLCRETQFRQLAALLLVSLRKISQYTNADIEVAVPAKPLHYARPWRRGNRKEQAC